jgi:hypothetical protein
MDGNDIKYYCSGSIERSLRAPEPLFPDLQTRTIESRWILA